ncbi:MAG: Flp family type IVb pilin [Bryobacteraceae bacterium]|jgi:Flp pilus assembly pilin Flp
MAVPDPVSFTDFLKSEQGQNLSEYCLIAAGIAAVGLLIILGVTGGLHNIWQIASTTTNAAGSGGSGTVAGQ